MNFYSEELQLHEIEVCTVCGECVVKGCMVKGWMHGEGMHGEGVDAW